MKKAKKGVLLLILGVISLFVVIPLWMIATGSLMSVDELNRLISPVLSGEGGESMWTVLPTYPTLRQFVELLLDTPRFFTMFWNTCKIVFPILIGFFIFGAPAAWAFAQYKFFGRKLLFYLYIALMLMPFQVTMVSSYIALNNLNLLNTVWAVILPCAFSTFPVFIMTKFFACIPAELIEAAQIDGASPLRIYLSIGIPLGAPGIISALLLGFFEYWNTIEQPMIFLENQSLWPLSLCLPSIVKENPAVAMAASLITLMPCVLIFLCWKKYLEKGIAFTGVKG